MRKTHVLTKICYWTAIGVLMCSGCAVSHSEEKSAIDFDKTPQNVSDAIRSEESTMETATNLSKEQTQQLSQDIASDAGIPAPEIIETDYSAYFDGLNGAAVFYDAKKGQYIVYNAELAETPRPPCSTFKIISSLVALENGILKPEDSMRTWSGEVFWNEAWNRDLDFRDAFRTSCVWYFREVIDAVGQERMQEALNRLQYGNCDISDWEGRLNTSQNNRALTGFWLESSLLISPKEQTQVMEGIFGTDSICSERTKKELRQVMLVTEYGHPDIKIYGKTGMGKADGITVDAWFAGFAENDTENKTVYFCVYLGRTDDQNVTSTAAKEIAVRLTEQIF